MFKYRSMVLYTWGAVCLFSILPLLSMQAQNNPFKINDKLYSYYQRCSRVRNDKKVFAMADTMFNMAKRAGDVKAQCLAKNLKGEYYYFNDDINNLLVEKEKIADFARKTPYKQYVFSAWNRIIMYYLSHNRIADALAETRKYQKEAILLNNVYGIGFSYKKMADIYTIMGNTNMAINELNKVVRYFKDNEKTEELPNVYLGLGNAYRSINNETLALDNYKLGLEACVLESTKGSFYIAIVRCYLKFGNMEQTDYYLSLLKEWEKSFPSTQANQTNKNVLYVDYYLKKKEYDKAYECCNASPSPVKYMMFCRIYEETGDYRNALINLRNYWAVKVKEENEKQDNIVAEYTARFDNERITNEKNLLELKNTKLKLEQLRTKDRLLAIDQEKGLLILSNTRLELNNKNLTLEQQKTEIERQKAKADRLYALRQNAKQKVASGRIFVMIVIISLLLLSIGLFAYAVQRRRSARRLRKEVENVSKAHDEAEKMRLIAEKARQEAENANNMKSLFLQNMSHEIRTPLNAIVGFSYVLSDPTMELDKTEKTEFSQLIQDNSQLLTTLINDILDISKLESGTYEIHLVDSSVKEICKTVLEAVSGRVADGVKLIYKPAEKDLLLNTDPQRVQQLLINFMTNACKYTEKGSITLAYEVQDDDHIVFSVTDTGVGIAPENAERIFNRFEKLDQFKQGTGIGLNICRAIADLLHGEVKVDMDYKDGARFLFIHPLHR